MLHTPAQVDLDLEGVSCEGAGRTGMRCLRLLHRLTDSLEKCVAEVKASPEDGMLVIAARSPFYAPLSVIRGLIEGENLPIE